ncbi:MAG: class E sortase [Actinobacteria bacterium]|nr:class E sortase [Actinomycetota bacterium]MCB9411373.1 class E sortase [Actinomycetota bacterium]
MRAVVRGGGEILITLGAILLLFVAYQLWFTTWQANRAAAANVSEIQQSWSDPDPQSIAAKGPDPAPVTEQPPVGTPFALMTVPRLGENINNKPLLQGVGFDELAQGLGHYPETAMPGQEGNFAVAGHRITLGEPLRYVETLEVGDNVYVETETYWYTYRLTRTEIVLPDAVWTITPDPFDTNAEPPARMITLTTCHPTFGNSHRWIWWGELVESTPKGDGAKAPEMKVNG